MNILAYSSHIFPRLFRKKTNETKRNGKRGNFPTTDGSQQAVPIIRMRKPRELSRLAAAPYSQPVVVIGVAIARK